MHLMNHLCWMQSLKNCLQPLNGHGSSSLGKTCVWPIDFCLFGNISRNDTFILSLDYIHLKCRISCHIPKEHVQQVWNIEYQKPNCKISYMIYIIHHIIQKDLYKTCEQKYRSQTLYMYSYVLIFRRVKSWSNERNIHPELAQPPSNQIQQRILALEVQVATPGSRISKKNRIRCVLFTMRMKKKLLLEATY